MPTRDVSVRIRADTTRFGRGLDTARGSLRRFSSGLRAVRGQAVSLKGAFAAAATAGIVVAANAARNSVDRFEKLATNLGTTSTQVRELELVANLAGFRLDDMVKAAQRMTVVIGDAQRGNKLARDSFDALGVSWEELDRAAPTDRLQMVFDALGKLESAGKRAVVANAIFGRQWQKLGPLFGDTSSFDRARRAVTDLGLGTTKIEDKGVTTLNDNLTVLASIGRNLRDKVFAQLAPSINDGVVALGSWVEQTIRAHGGATNLARVLSEDVTKGFKNAAAFIGPTKDLFKDLAETTGPLIKALSRVGASIVKATAGAVGAVVAASRGDIAEAGRVLENTGDDIAGEAEKIADAVDRGRISVFARTTGALAASAGLALKGQFRAAGDVFRILKSDIDDIFEGKNMIAPEINPGALEAMEEAIAKILRQLSDFKFSLDIETRTQQIDSIMSAIAGSLESRFGDAAAGMAEKIRQKLMALGADTRNVVEGAGIALKTAASEQMKAIAADANASVRKTAVDTAASEQMKAIAADANASVRKTAVDTANSAFQSMQQIAASVAASAATGLGKIGDIGLESLVRAEPLIFRAGQAVAGVSTLMERIIAIQAEASKSRQAQSIDEGTSRSQLGFTFTGAKFGEPTEAIAAMFRAAQTDIDQTLNARETKREGLQERMPVSKDDDIVRKAGEQVDVLRQIHTSLQGKLVGHAG